MRTYSLTITTTRGTSHTVNGMTAQAVRDYLNGVHAFRGMHFADALLNGADQRPTGGFSQVAADGFVGSVACRFEGDSDSLTTDREAVEWWAGLSDSERTDAAEWWPADAERAAALFLEARAQQAAEDFRAASVLAVLDAEIVRRRDSDHAAALEEASERAAAQAAIVAEGDRLHAEMVQHAAEDEQAFVEAVDAQRGAERTHSAPVDGEATYAQHPAGFYFEVSDLPGSDFGPFETVEACEASVIFGRSLEFDRARHGLTDREAHLTRFDYVLFEVRDGERVGRMAPSAHAWALAGLDGEEAQQAARAADSARFLED